MRVWRVSSLRSPQKEVGLIGAPAQLHQGGNIRLPPNAAHTIAGAAEHWFDHGFRDTSLETAEVRPPYRGAA